VLALPRIISDENALLSEAETEQRTQIQARDYYGWSKRCYCCDVAYAGSSGYGA
jgi:hypothetical protein